MHVYKSHLTYCTNIHAGESWQEVFESIQKFIPHIKTRLGVQNPFGIGLRLSALAASQLLSHDHLMRFATWLSLHNCYVFTINGFPYGGFHHQNVKDHVHQPDWQSEERLLYTQQLADILAYLLPDQIEGSISTSPLSYKYWHDSEHYDEVFSKSTLQLQKMIDYLHQIFLKTGKYIHLDLEPEPDGMLEKSTEVVEYFDRYLLKNPPYKPYHSDEWHNLVKKYIQICYDVCHFALAFEQIEHVILLFEPLGIKIGKIQISAAIKVDIPHLIADRNDIAKELSRFAESTYLHQVVSEQNQYRDLPLALETIAHTSDKQWRIHFHVPIFLEKYGVLHSTQSDIRDVLKYWRKNHFCSHLEIETYTWEVLPSDLKLDLSESISREYQWVLNQIEIKA
jgi:hypothetical protein